MYLHCCHVIVVFLEERTSAPSLSVVVKVQPVECLHTAYWKKEKKKRGGKKKKANKKSVKYLSARFCYFFLGLQITVAIFWSSVDVYNFCKDQTELPVHFWCAPCWIVPISLSAVVNAADSAVLNCSLDHSICMQHKCKLSCLRVKLKHVCVTWINFMFFSLFHTLLKCCV